MSGHFYKYTRIWILCIPLLISPDFYRAAAFILHKRLIVIYFMLFISGGSAIFTAIFINL